MSQDNAATVQEIEVSIEHARKVVDKRNNMFRMFKNRDFKSIILTGYFEDEPVRLTKLMAHPSMQSADDQDYIQKQLTAIGFLHQYFNTIRVQGDMFEREIGTHEEALVELENEDEGSE